MWRKVGRLRLVGRARWDRHLGVVVVAVVLAVGQMLLFVVEPHLAVSAAAAVVMAVMAVAVLLRSPGAETAAARIAVH